MDAIVADLKLKLQKQGWTLCDSQTPEPKHCVEIVMSSGNGGRAYFDSQQWISADSGYTIYTEIIAWREAHDLDSFAFTPFVPFKKGDLNATIGYWAGQGEDSVFNIIATMSNNGSTYSPDVFHGVVLSTVRHLKDAYHANLSLDVYSRQDAPVSLNTEGDFL